MVTGADIAKLGRWSLCLCFVAACGGRTLDDGVYEADGATGDSSSCIYRGTTYATGSAVDGVCFCFCDQGEIECEPGCSSPSGGFSGGGAAGSGTVISTGGTAGKGGTSSGGFGATGATSTGGTTGTGATGNLGATGGVATAGATGTGGTIGEAGEFTGGFGGGTTALMCSPVVPIATGKQPLIDTMEDGDSFISPFEVRAGTWYAYNDGSFGAFQQPTPPTFFMTFAGIDATGGNYVANTIGKGFASWGAGIGFVLNNGCAYNAKVYRGISFYARSEQGPASIYFLVGTSATTPVLSGGTCSGVCYDDYQTPIGLDDDWRGYSIPFGQLAQQGWGTPVFFDPATLVNVNFQTIPGGGESFSFSIDSVSFF